MAGDRWIGTSRGLSTDGKLTTFEIEFQIMGSNDFKVIITKSRIGDEKQPDSAFSYKRKG